VLTTLLRPLLALLIFVPLFQAPAPPQPATNQSGNQPSSATVQPTATDPATIMFSTAIGLIVVPVHAGKTADYEAVIVALQDALSKAEDAETRTMAAGWRVFRSADTDAKSNALYIHVLAPAVAGVDYRPSQWLDKLLGGAPPELLTKYRDAFAGAPSKLGLVELAHMSVTPVTKAANVSPAGPVSPPKPGNGSSTQPLRQFD
jgi:hypothetical protein